METVTPTNSKFFNNDLYQKIFLLIVGFIFTGILGAFIGFYLQSKSVFNSYKLNLIESERKAARDIFEDITTAMDARIYRAQVFNDSFSANTKVNQANWNDYKNEIGQWNKNINRRIELSGLYFGSDISGNVKQIRNDFRHLNGYMDELKTGNVTIKDSIYSKINFINDEITKFSIKTANLIQKDSVGRIPKLNRFKFSNYLFN